MADVISCQSDKRMRWCAREWLVALGIAFAVQIWCIDRGGPRLRCLNQPVQTLVVAFMASVALGEEFYLGGIIRVELLVVGLYLMMWVKNKERKYVIEKARSSATRTTGAMRSRP